LKAHAIIPVKPPSRGKTRLSTILSISERRELVQRMLSDVLAAALQAHGVERVLVVSPDAAVLRLALQQGAQPLLEQGPTGLNRAVEYGLERLLGEGVEAALVLPGDIPLAQPRELDAITSLAAGKPSVALAPSRDERGTNALLQAPPLIISPRYGPSSFPLHLKAAREAGVPARVIRREGLALDIDTVDDIRELVRRGGETRTQGYLAEISVEDRIGAWKLSQAAQRRYPRTRLNRRDK